jgi:pimeloyl-ACP methyl ester carboxylesterase
LTPIFFGAGPRRLFGVYDPAVRNPSEGLRAAVICNPWGPEYIYAHRALRQLARRLSLAGFHTLRFDYFGTGDSAGDMVDADLLGWKNDIETAMDELIDLAGVKRVALVGLRLGATLAASVVCTRRKEIGALVLWEPIFDGKAYFDGLDVMSASDQNWDNNGPSLRDAELSGGHEIEGFTIAPRMAEEIRSLDLLATMSACPSDTKIMLLHPMSRDDNLQGAVEKNCPIEYVNDAPVWTSESSYAGLVPVNAINRITFWLSQCR